MQYFGGKQRIAKHLVPFIEATLEETKSNNFYDLFCGSCNIVSNIDPKYYRHANDIREFMVATMSVKPSFEFPDIVTEEDYQAAKSLPTTDPLHGFILVGCSFAGKYKGGYARDLKRGQNFANSARRGIKKKIDKLQGVIWSNDCYSKIKIKPSSLVYCDIPYHSTTRYDRNFNHDKFYKWVSKQEATILISEYDGSYNPLGLPTVWNKESQKGVRGADGKVKPTLEILRRYN